MNDKERAVIQQALEAIGDCSPNKALVKAAYALREALAEQALQKLSDFHQSIEEPTCKQHPDAPHGFDRNASHGAGRYVCECEGWEPEPAEQEDKDLVAQMNVDVGLRQKVYEALDEQAAQEPECKYKEAYIIWQDKTEWVQETAHPKELGMHRADVLRQRIENLQNAATHLVRTKDLTGQDLCDLEIAVGWKGDSHDFDVIVKAVIAKYKEKNK